MMRSVAAKVAWVGRTASTVFGLALVMALVLGISSMAFGANGGNFILGQLNRATAITKLVGNVEGGPTLQVTNTNPAHNSRPLHLDTFSGRAPLTVNATAGRATNLNADKVDGSEGEMWAQINANGTADRWKGMTGNELFGAGKYDITFARSVRGCALSATIADDGLLVEPPGFIGVGPVHPNLGNDSLVIVRTYNASGVAANKPFHLVVLCGDHQSA